MTKQPLPPAVSLRGLTKRYGDRAAVEDLTIDVPAGVVAGFVGPNGAGKTTTMAMLLGLVTPTEGTGSVLGAPLADPASYLGRVGALIEGPAFYPGLTGAQNLAVLATAGGHDPAEVPELLELVGLGERGDDRFRRYSFGMKQRLGIAGALLGDPSLLILDEPINGLDPAGVHEMRGLIGRLASGERTVLVSSHVLAELEQVCDWLIVIDGGRLIFQGPADELLDRTGARLVVAPEHPADLDRLGGLLAAAGHDGHPHDDHLEIAVNGSDPRGLAAAVNRTAGSGGIVLAELRVARTSLEDRYLTMMNGGRAMITMFKAELLKLRRRRVAAAVAITALAFAAIASAGVFLSATESGAPGSERGATVASLGQAGGATAAFAIGTSFVGILVLVLFIANVAGEFSQGTFRTLLMRQPRRVGLLAGKMAALLVLAAIVLALALVLTVAASAAIAPSQDVSTASWFGLDGLGEAAGDYATALFGVAAWAALGMALAIFVRSIPVALAIGIVWSGPFEHLLEDAWGTAGQWFPGLLLEALAAGGTPDVSASRALVLVALYVTAAAGAAGLVFARRDITA